MYPSMRVVLLFAALPLLARCRPSRCFVHPRDPEQINCRKIMYQADWVRVRNIVDSEVSFLISKWMSGPMAPGGIIYYQKWFSLGRGESVDIEFGEALYEDTANEVFALQCMQYSSNKSSSTNCNDLLEASIVRAPQPCAFSLPSN